MSYEKLSLRAQYMLLSQHPDRPKRITSDFHFNYGMATACILELGQMGCLELNEKGKLKPQRLLHCKEPSLKHILEILQKRKKPYSLKQTLQRVVQLIAPAIRATRQELIEAGAFSMEEKRFLGIIPYKRYHLRKAQWQDTLVHELQNEVKHKDYSSAKLQHLLILTSIGKLHAALAEGKDQVKATEAALKTYLSDHKMHEALAEVIKSTEVAMVFTGTLMTSSVTLGR